jgi:hypothetical protein
VKPTSEVPSTEARVAPAATQPGNFICSVAQSLCEISAEDVARLPEDQFVNVFLPLLAGDTELPYPATIADWISIAGSPYKCVDVFDNSTGEILFRVPPFFDYHGVNPVRNISKRGGAGRPDQPAFTDIIATAANLAGLHANQARAFVEQSLRSRAKLMDSNVLLARHVLQFNAILKRYGRKPLFAESEQAAIAAREAAARESCAAPDVYEDF